MTYENVMKMPLKDFNDLLIIKRNEEIKKSEMLKEQQDKSMKTLNGGKGTKEDRGPSPFFRMFANNGAQET